jgi:hypothetical protein
MNEILVKNINTLIENSGITDKQFKEYMELNDEEYKNFIKGDFNYTSVDIDKLSSLFLVDIHELIEIELREYKSYIFNEELSKEDVENLSKINKITNNQFEMDKINKESL